MIILSQTYTTYTPESVEDGESADAGFDWEDSPHTFREVVDIIRDGGFIYPSCSHGVPDWLSTETGTTDYWTGESEEKSLHPGSDARSQRYWEKACRAAGIIK